MNYLTLKSPNPRNVGTITTRELNTNPAYYQISDKEIAEYTAMDSIEREFFVKKIIAQEAAKRASLGTEKKSVTIVAEVVEAKIEEPVKETAETIIEPIAVIEAEEIETDEKVVAEQKAKGRPKKEKE